MSLERRRKEEGKEGASVINLNLIPTRPPVRVGPFQLHNDHLVSANLHKKVLGRRETLYLTEKKEARGGKRLFFGTLAALAIVAVLVGVILLCTVGEKEQLLGHLEASTMPLVPTTPAPPASSSNPEVVTSNTSSTTQSGSIASMDTTSAAPLDTNYLPIAADVEFSLVNVTYDETLADNSSQLFHDLSHALHISIVEVLTHALNLSDTLMQVQVFSPGGGDTVYVKLRLVWAEPPLPFHAIGSALMSTSVLGHYHIKHLKSYGVYNMCRFRNNGCSHNCSFSDFQFRCSCPHPLTLASNKLCESPTTTTTTATLPPVETTPSQTPSPSPTTTGAINPSTSTTTTSPTPSPQPLAVSSTQSPPAVTTTTHPSTPSPSTQPPPPPPPPPTTPQEDIAAADTNTEQLSTEQVTQEETDDGEVNTTTMTILDELEDITIDTSTLSVVEE